VRGKRGGGGVVIQQRLDRSFVAAEVGGLVVHDHQAGVEAGGGVAFDHARARCRYAVDQHVGERKRAAGVRAPGG
jgi:hypothetical protein